MNSLLSRGTICSAGSLAYCSDANLYFLLIVDFSRKMVRT